MLFTFRAPMGLMPAEIASLFTCRSCLSKSGILRADAVRLADFHSITVMASMLVSLFSIIRAGKYTQVVKFYILPHASARAMYDATPALLCFLYRTGRICSIFRNTIDITALLVGTHIGAPAPPLGHTFFNNEMSRLAYAAIQLISQSIQPIDN